MTFLLLEKLMSDSKEWNKESAAKEQGHHQSQTISVADLKWQVMPWRWNMMISTLFHCTCCKSPNGNDVATKDRHFESFESKYSFKLLFLASAELVLQILMQVYE